MSDLGIFPFGNPIRKVEQKDKSRKRVFVLGVYASAVHARWIGPDGKQLISAVGVVSEPEIFWTGEDAVRILESIEMPEGAGRLVPASETLNGPSGRALDECFLEPLRLKRKDVWLCDLVPYSCMNGGQAKALARAYTPKMASWNLPPVRWGKVPSVLADETRRREIEREIGAADPEILITLGDMPLRWLTHFHGSLKTLKGYGMDKTTYGRIHPIQINGKDVGLLPLVHPRQAARLGRHSPQWASLHELWCENTAASLGAQGN